MRAGRNLEEPRIAPLCDSQGLTLDLPLVSQPFVGSLIIRPRWRERRFRSLGGEIDPPEAGGEGHERFVAGRGVAVAHFFEGAGDSTGTRTAVFGSLVVAVAFGEQRDNFAVALGAFARRHGFSGWGPAPSTPTPYY